MNLGSKNTYRIFAIAIVIINVALFLLLSIIPYGISAFLDQPEIPFQFRANYPLPRIIVCYTPLVLLVFFNILLIKGLRNKFKLISVGISFSLLLYLLLYLYIPKYIPRLERQYSKKNVQYKIQIREYPDGNTKYFQWSRESCNSKMQNRWNLDSTSFMSDTITTESYLMQLQSSN